MRELAARGVLYIGLAHLFWRGVATNAPALPFLPDALYNLLFPQKGKPGLSPLGEAAVRAMYATGVLSDISHMSEDAIDGDVQARRGARPRGGADPTDYPVIASHAGYRFGGQSYNLTDGTIARIAARGGVIGLILAQHQLNDGVRRTDTQTLRRVARRGRAATSTRSAPSTSRSAPTSTGSSSRRSAASSRPPTSRRSRPRCARVIPTTPSSMLTRQRAAGHRAPIRSTLTPRHLDARLAVAAHQPQQHAVAARAAQHGARRPRRRARWRPGRSRRSRRRSTIAVVRSAAKTSLSSPAAALPSFIRSAPS